MITRQFKTLFPLACLLFASAAAQAGVITVGKSGVGNNCTVPTIQAAIERAKGFGGYNLIWVTNDVPDGEWRENLVIQDAPDNLELELVGGFADCIATVPSGRTRISGVNAHRPTLKIRDKATVHLRSFALTGGNDEDDGWGSGIDFVGRGLLTLADVGIEHNVSAFLNTFALNFEGRGGVANLLLAGNVSVSDNPNSGIAVRGSAFLELAGAGNRIERNRGAAGVVALAPATAQLGAGTVVADNEGVGVWVYSEAGGTSPSYTSLSSGNPHDPVRIVGNRNGGLHATWWSGHPIHVCATNVDIVGNGPGIAVLSGGEEAYVDLNGLCAYPPDSAIACADDGLSGCNRISGNEVHLAPLAYAVRGGSLWLDRALVEGNSATSVLSTNLGAGASDASITLTHSLVVGNEMRDNLFESLGGGIVDIWDSTVAGNGGGFNLSLVGIDPRLLQLTNTIMDQPQALMEFTGDAATVHLTRVLASNTTGSHPDDEIVVAAPAFIPGTWQLRADSPGVDHAPAGGGLDYAARPRDVDTDGIPNVHGPRDIGAYESQVPVFIEESIFGDGFDPVPLVAPAGFDGAWLH